jgi:hypothetical protein
MIRSGTVEVDVGFSRTCVACSRDVVRRDAPVARQKGKKLYPMDPVRGLGEMLPLHVSWHGASHTRTSQLSGPIPVTECRLSFPANIHSLVPCLFFIHLLWFFSSGHAGNLIAINLDN